MTDKPHAREYMGPAFNTPITSYKEPRYYREVDDDSPLPPEPLPLSKAYWPY